MTDREINGSKAPINPLGEALERHARTLLKLNELPNGMIQLNASQLFCDLEVTMVRIEVLFEVLAEAGLVDAKALAERLCAKLNAESDQMQGQINEPRIALALGRDIGRRN